MKMSWRKVRVEPPLEEPLAAERAALAVLERHGVQRASRRHGISGVVCDGRSAPCTRYIEMCADAQSAADLLGGDEAALAIQDLIEVAGVAKARLGAAAHTSVDAALLLCGPLRTHQRRIQALRTWLARRSADLEAQYGRESWKDDPELRAGREEMRVEEEAHSELLEQIRALVGELSSTAAAVAAAEAEAERLARLSEARPALDAAPAAGVEVEILSRHRAALETLRAQMDSLGELARGQHRQIQGS